MTHWLESQHFAGCANAQVKWSECGIHARARGRIQGEEAEPKGQEGQRVAVDASRACGRVFDAHLGMCA